jgi:uncharacterized protein (UPF0332 family)
MNDFERCVKERRLIKIKPSKEMIQKELDSAEMVENLELCMSLRHEADYGLTYYQESAETAIKYAEEFLNNALKLI